jgi:hypothetical protein
MRNGWRMNLRPKVSVSICLLVVLSIFVYSAQIPGAHSWGAQGHQFIESKAENVFSTNSFFSINHNTLYTWCTRPDSVPNFMPDGGGNGDWHYLDGHSYNPLVYSGGELPWAMEWIFDNIVQYLENGNWNTAVQLMGAICHFAGDSTQPLHSTWNYNPNNKHSAYETTALGNHIGEISIPDNYLPQKIDNVTAAALASLAKSFSYTAEGANPGDNNLTAFLDNNITWNGWIRSMTENRLRSAVQFTANVWYSAMIQAGLTIQASTLTSPSDGSSTSDNTPTFTWTSVSGTNSYDFQLASDNNFTINARTVKSLSTTSYTPVNPLTNGVWYWHVRTGDNSADVGLWSQTGSFTVSGSTQNPVVVISPSSQIGADNATLTYTVTVTNTENVSDNFNLTTNDNASPSWRPTVSPTILTIPAAENRTSTLSVHIPSSAIGGTIDNVTVTATGTGASGSASCTAQVIIMRGVQVAITQPVQENDNGGTLKYDVLVKNLGNVLENFQLTKGDNTGWILALDNNWLLVPKGENRTTKLTVNIPTNATAGTIDNITVTATSQTDNTVSASASCIAEATFGTATFDTLRLVTGWNLVGFPVDNENTTPASIFPGLIYPDNYTVYWWNAPSGPYQIHGQTTPFNDNTGYWIYLNTPMTVIIFGTNPSSRSISLVTGWNLVCFPIVSTSTTPASIFTGLTYPDNYSVYWWNAPSGPYQIQGPTSPFNDNTGYWIYLNTPQTVTVP